MATGKSVSYNRPSNGSSSTAKMHSKNSLGRAATPSGIGQIYSSLPLPVKFPSSPTKPSSSSFASASSKPASTLTRKAAKPKLSSGDNEPLKAFLRIRPASADKQDGKDQSVDPYITVVNETEVLMSPPKDAASNARARVYAASVPTKYTFSRIFPGDVSAEEASQSTFFQHTTLPLVDELLQGQSGLIFTYGVTNSGKSYTVQGGHGPDEAGILPRSIDVVFNSIQGVQSNSDIRPVGLAGVEYGTDDQRSRTSRQSNVSDASGLNPFSLPGMSKQLNSNSAESAALRQYTYDSTSKVRVDRNYRYSVWISYVEVYNEKIFDLLDVQAPTGSTPSAGMSSSGSTFSLSRSDSRRGSNWALASQGAGASDPSSANGAIFVQRRPLALKNDIEAGGKYVAGVQEIRVRSSAEARELMQRGQENRRVFSTMANRASSRSHGVFTIKLIREHGGEGDGAGDTLTCLTSRLSIVDLAGSERIGNTSATGDRLKEAGSINKSLMCLGQCIETLRKNQIRAASFIPAPIQPIGSANVGNTSNASSTTTASSSSSSKTSTGVLPRVLKRRPSIVPFRHSKLTELFQSFFTGEGRAVMIVNVNPLDTGFDENSHVMRFSAAAKEIHTIRTQAQTTNLSRFVHPSLRNLFNGRPSQTKQASEVHSPTFSPPPSCPPTPKASSAMLAPPTPTPKKSQQSAVPFTGAPKSSNAAKALPKLPATTKSDKSAMALPIAPERKDSAVQAAQPYPDHLEVTIIEVSDDEDAEDDEATENDPFVEHLMQQYEEMRQALFESQMQCAAIEREVREEMAEEMAEQLRTMEQMYNERMLADAEQNEEFVNRKLDLLARASAYGSRASQEYEEESFEEDDYDSADDDETREEPSEDEDGEVERALAVSLQDESGDVEGDCTDSTTRTASADEDSMVFESDKRSTLTPANRGAEISHDYLDEDAEADDSHVQDSSVLESDDEEAIDTSESIIVPARMLRKSQRITSYDDEDDEDEEEEEEEQSLSSVHRETSDESFDVTEDSIESSFEAAPRARASRSRPSAAVPAAVARSAGGRAKATPSSAAKKTAAGTKATSSASRRTTTSTRTKSMASHKGRVVTPLGESSAANTSQEVNSDASLILVAQSKTPKRKLMGRKTLMDEETMIEQIGDSSLLDELHRRAS